MLDEESSNEDDLKDKSNEKIAGAPDVAVVGHDPAAPSKAVFSGR